ncbi:MAG: dihydroorotate dehydrogenase electron transfer subunit, partial [Clostridiales bacterium]|nr:dihydroorotate dehydrogenase electron transfer subunit [Clostridiales bacterium]
FCEILDIRQLNAETYDVVVRFPETAAPGQFIHVLCGGDTLLRRPISICDAEPGKLRFTFAARGEGTRLLARKKRGDTLDILAPLGNGFNVTKKGDGVPVVVGGGIGVFPLYFLSKCFGGAAEAVLGFRCAEAVLMAEEFAAVCAATELATDDGSLGFHGFAADLLAARLARGGVTSVYACGPAPMLRAVKRVAEERRVYCQLSLEQRMGCGIGACAVCVCNSGGEFVKVCQKGPVFDAGEVDFDA